MTAYKRPGFGDNVAIRRTPETEAAGLAGKRGVVNGETTPSVTAVDVIGQPKVDFALAVMFEEGPIKTAWFAEELVEFIDHAPGTEFIVGNVKAVRMADGSWKETTLDGKPLKGESSHRPWWKFW